MRQPPANASRQPTANELKTTAPKEVAGSTDEKHSLNWDWIAWPLVVLILYVLSVGPVIRMVDRGVLSQRSLALYWPVIWAYDNTALHKPIGLYIHFWVPGAADEKGGHF